MGLLRRGFSRGYAQHCFNASLTREIDRDSMRCALAGALVAFGRQTNCRIVAEGVESAAELGVNAAQGYHLGRPAPIESFPPLAAAETGPPGGRQGGVALRG
jgi:EAL domain-containing protein (putative c-di-GMP-specific phosphodiesterase class I)